MIIYWATRTWNEYADNSCTPVREVLTSFRMRSFVKDWRIWLTLHGTVVVCCFSSSWTLPPRILLSFLLCFWSRMDTINSTKVILVGCLWICGRAWARSAYSSSEILLWLWNFLTLLRLRVLEHEKHPTSQEYGRSGVLLHISQRTRQIGTWSVRKRPEQAVRFPWYIMWKHYVYNIYCFIENFQDWNREMRSIPIVPENHLWAISSKFMRIRDPNSRPLTHIRGIYGGNFLSHHEQSASL